MLTKVVSNMLCFSLEFELHEPQGKQTLTSLPGIAGFEVRRPEAYQGLFEGSGCQAAAALPHGDYDINWIAGKQAFEASFEQ